MIFTFTQTPFILWVFFNLIDANTIKPESCDASKTEQICTNKGFRFYYNSPMSQCVQFWGCPGSVNNFATLAECQATCEDYTYEINEQNNQGICQQPQVIGPCRSSFRRYYFNNVLQRCEIFTYGGCQGNQNNFLSITDCQSSCENNSRDICQLSAEPGPCRSNIRKYYYNNSVQRCQTFTYGGCQGNKNNFNTLMECQNFCESKSTDYNPCESGSPLLDTFGQTMTCTFGISAQMCPYTHECINTFNGLKVCCPKRVMTTFSPISWPGNPIDVCSLPKAVGNCRSHSTRWYYNSFLQDCQQFTYSGCLGNQNNFPSKQECESKCIYFGGLDNPCPFGTPLLDHRTNLEVKCGVCPYQYTCHTGNIADKPAVCCPQQDNNNNPVLPRVNPCKQGEPIIDQRTNQEKTCGFFPHDQRCPVTHECNSEIADRPAVCCPKIFHNRANFAG